MKTLTAPELHHLRRLVEELISIMVEDNTGILMDIDDRILIAAEILGIREEPDSEA
mgnify:CR=1 FL=1